ncbi:MAG: methylaspartate mutase accessory protein GlmL [bacterium]|jgi:uncharacterized protein (TIGR01319 family)
MSMALTIDLGSTFTKATLFDLEKPAYLGRAQAPTTVSTDVTIGLRAALAKLQEETGRDPYSAQVKLASSSAAGGLKMVAIGLVPELTAEAARRSALGAGAKVEAVFSYTLTSSDVNKLLGLEPDLVLLAGGTDGGNGEVVVKNAAALAGSALQVPVIYAGNRVMQDEVAHILTAAGKEVFFAGNVMPEFGVLDTEPTSQVVRELFLSRITQAKGIKGAESLVDGIIMPTPTAVLKGADLLATGTKFHPGVGDLLIIDVGGATTDVHSVALGAPRRPGVIHKGLPEPRVKRTVEGDLGLRCNAPSILAAVGGEALLENFTASRPMMEELPKMVDRLGQSPGTLPETSIGQELDRALAQAAAIVGLSRHCGRLEEVFTLEGRKEVQYGKDLTGVKVVLGTGGFFANARWGRGVIEAALGKLPPATLGPREAEVVLDSDYLLAAAGLLAEVEPDAALLILRTQLGLGE